MIKSLDRSGYFGASDTYKYVMAKNRHSVSWIKWWDVKLGLREPDPIWSREIEAGNKYEPHILKAIGEDVIRDGQIIYEKYKIRVNYDGYRDGTIYEVKTHHEEKGFDLSQAYWQQSQVEMFVYKKLADEYFLSPFNKLYLVSYGLYQDEYEIPEDEINIDPNRIKYTPIEFDKAMQYEGKTIGEDGWVKGKYLPKVKELARALEKGKQPK